MVDTAISFQDMIRALDHWETLPPMSTPRRWMSSAVVDGKFYAIGGRSDASTDLNSTEIYDPTTNSWTPGPSLPRASWSANAVSLNGKILLIGGEGSVHWDEVLELDPITGQWTSKASMPTGRSGHSGVVWNGKIYVAGGWEIGRDGFSFSYSYDPQLDVWTDLASLIGFEIGLLCLWLVTDYIVLGVYQNENTLVFD